MGEQHIKLDLPTKLLIVAVGVGAVLTALPGSAEPSDAAADSSYRAQVVGDDDPDVIPGQYIVVLKAPATGEDNAALEGAVDRAEDRGADVTHEYGDAINGYAATMSDSELAKVRQDPAVAYIAADQRMSVSGTRTVPNGVWGLDRIDQRSLPLNGKLSTTGDGSGVTAYVIDTGIRATHEDLTGRVISGFTSISDGRGTDDCAGHGTHVAGTVGGTRFGVAPKVNLVAVRVFGCTGSGDASDVVDAVNWVTANHVSPAVVNMSLGGTAYSVLDSAVNASINSGLTYVVAAGNEAVDSCSTSPARVPAAITVAASTKDDAHASFSTKGSNYGSCVDIYAPGKAITSSWYTADNAYATAEGTSMASPHVAGAAALYLQANPGASPAEVSSAILGNSTSGALTGVPANTPNKLLYVGSATATPTPTPTTTTPTPAATSTTSPIPTTTAPTPSTEPTTQPTTQPTTAPTTTPAPVTTAPTTTAPAPAPTKTTPASSRTGTVKGKLTVKSKAVTASTYTSKLPGTHVGALTGPRGTNFDLALQKWNGKRWVEVADGHKASSTEKVSYRGTSGKYRWLVERVKGKGTYTLKLTRAV